MRAIKEMECLDWNTGSCQTYLVLHTYIPTSSQFVLVSFTLHSNKPLHHWHCNKNTQREPFLAALYAPSNVWCLCASNKNTTTVLIYSCNSMYVYKSGTVHVQYTNLLCCVEVAADGRTCLVQWGWHTVGGLVQSDSTQASHKKTKPAETSRHYKWLLM